MSTQVIVDSAVAVSQNFVTLEFCFQPTGALATNGSILPLCRAQRGVAAKAFCAVGLGDLSTAKLTAAQALALVAKPVDNGGMIPEILPLKSNVALVATGLKAFTDAVEATADGKRCIVFAIGGVKMSDVISVDLVHSNNGNAAGGLLCGVSDGVRLYDTASTVVGATGKLIKDASLTEVALSDKLIFSPVYQFVAGTFLITEADNITLAATDVVTLRVRLAV
jgi:hypothetical protein